MAVTFFRQYSAKNVTRITKIVTYDIVSVLPPLISLIIMIEEQLVPNLLLWFATVWSVLNGKQ
jgi:hypothetical protein